MARTAPPAKGRRGVRGCALILGAALAAAGCTGDRRDDADLHEVTDAERSAFVAPTDSALSPEQVDRYLRTTLAQLELVARELPERRRRIAEAASVPVQPGDTMRRPTSMERWSDFLEETYVRASRRTDANPAEMEYVGDRMRQVAGYLAASDVRTSGAEMARLLRQQAEALRGQPGVSASQIEQTLRAADDAERQTVHAPPPRVRQNLETIRATRPAVDDATWLRLTRVSGGVGLMALGDMEDSTAQGMALRITELRDLHARVLTDRPPGPR